MTYVKGRNCREFRHLEHGPEKWSSGLRIRPCSRNTLAHAVKAIRWVVYGDEWRRGKSRGTKRVRRHVGQKTNWSFAVEIGGAEPCTLGAAHAFLFPNWERAAFGHCAAWLRSYSRQSASQRAAVERGATVSDIR
jgi:hypothetical protein